MTKKLRHCEQVARLAWQSILQYKQNRLPRSLCSLAMTVAQILAMTGHFDFLQKPKCKNLQKTPYDKLHNKQYKKIQNLRYKNQKKQNPKQKPKYDKQHNSKSHNR